MQKRDASRQSVWDTAMHACMHSVSQSVTQEAPLPAVTCMTNMSSNIYKRKSHFSRDSRQQWGPEVFSPSGAASALNYTPHCPISNYGAMACQGAAGPGRAQWTEGALQQAQCSINSSCMGLGLQGASNAHETGSYHSGSSST